MSNSDFIVPATLFITVKDQLNGLDAIDRAHNLADYMVRNHEQDEMIDIDLHVLHVAKEVAKND